MSHFIIEARFHKNARNGGRVINGDREPPLDPEEQNYVKEFVYESVNRQRARNVAQESATGFAKRRLLIQCFF